MELVLLSLVLGTHLVYGPYWKDRHDKEYQFGLNYHLDAILASSSHETGYTQYYNIFAVLQSYSLLLSAFLSAFADSLILERFNRLTRRKYKPVRENRSNPVSSGESRALEWAAAPGIRAVLFDIQQAQIVAVLQYPFYQALRVKQNPSQNNAAFQTRRQHIGQTIDAGFEFRRIFCLDHFQLHREQSAPGKCASSDGIDHVSSN